MKRKRLFLLNDQTAPRINSDLACEIGLNESIILLQFEFWQSISDHYHEDKYWFYNSMHEIRETFRFWSVETIKRTVASIVKRRFVFTGNFNKSKFDKTTWYSLNFEELAKLKSIRIDGLTDSVNLTSSKENVMISDSVNLTSSVGSICPDGKGQFDLMGRVNLTSCPIQRDLTERSAETTDRLTRVSESVSQSVPPQLAPEHEQGRQEKADVTETHSLSKSCKVNNKSVALIIESALKSYSHEYVSLQIAYVNDKCKDSRGFRKLLDMSIRNNYGQAWKDDAEITAREREAAAEKAKRAIDTANALKAFQTHSGKKKAVTDTLSEKVSETAPQFEQDTKISEFLSGLSEERIDTMKSDFLKNAKTLIKKRARTQGFDSLLVQSAFESYINKEVMADETGKHTQAA